MTTADELLRFPIGRFTRRSSYTTAERAAHLERLATQPARLAAAVAGFTQTDWSHPYRPGGWTVRQLVHHVADSHVNAYIRLKLGLTESEPTIKPYDQDAWVALADAALPPDVSMTLLTATHARWCAVLHHMDDAAFARTIVHPENGVMTLDQLTALYAWHGDHHIAHVDAYRATRS